MDNPTCPAAAPTFDIRDALSLRALQHVFPRETVDRIIAASGRKEERVRLLPSHVVVYYVLALTLFMEDSAREVMRKLAESFLSMGLPMNWHVPNKASLSMARARLGVEPFRTMYEEVVKPIARPEDTFAFYRARWRVMAIDGVRLDVADTPSNAAAFGRPANSRGDRSAYPQVQVLGLAECGTHGYVDLVLGGCREGETTLAQPLLRSLTPDMLCLADRNFFGYPTWKAWSDKADLLWRVKKNLTLECERSLPDGSYLARVYPSSRARSRQRGGIWVRVIRFVLDSPGAPGKPLETYRLITTVLDHREAPAEELAALYCERWEFETANDELKTHQRGRREVLRSGTPDGTRQEVYAFFLAHYAIRCLMYDAARQAKIDPDRLSFTHTLHVIQRKVITQALFFPQRFFAADDPQGDIGRDRPAAQVSF
jgi:hypothetical protein